MKFVQTFWTSPSKIKNNDPVNRFNGGFPSEKHHAMSWAYSFYSLKKFHPDHTVKLHTDSDGAKWLIDKLGIPYDQVELSLDNFSNYPKALWALSKIQTYSLQKEPFLHLDGDIYLWAPFPQSLLEREVIAQHVEIVTKGYDIYNPMYTSLLKHARENLSYIPSFLDNIMDKQDLIIFSAGLVGGKDLDLIHKYTKAAFNFVDYNIDKFNNSEIHGEYNMFIEQWFYAILSLEKYKLNDEIGLLFPEEYPLPLFGLVPQFQKYVHMGHLKRDKLAVSHLEERFKFDFPKVASHINKIFPESKLFYLDLPEQIYSNDLRHTKHELQKLFGSRLFRNETIKDEIEGILEKNIDDPNYFTLWDLYQIESHNLDLGVLSELEENKKWNILYDTTVSSFMKIHFVLNVSISQIIYLYNDWEVQKQKNSTYPLLIKNGDALNPSPWIITTTFDFFDITRISGWNKLLLLFENQQVLSGEEIVKRLKKSNSFEYEEKSIDQNVYSFLTLQYFVYNRLEIVSF